MNLDDSESDSRSLQHQLDRKNAELRNSIRRLQDAEKRIKKYEEATLEAYGKVDMMEEKLQNEQRCLAQAVHVASRLYSRNTEFKTRTIRDKKAALSARRKAWKEGHSSKEEDVEPTQQSSEVQGIDSTLQNSNHPSNKVQSERQKDVDSSDDDLREIVSLDQKSKNHLDAALEKASHLERQNQEMAKKITSLETSVLNKEDMIAHLQSVVEEKNCELKELREKFEMESEVRQSAESYAARMYGKNKAFQRRSLLLKSRRGESFDKNLEDIMKDVERLTGELEEERVKRKQEVTILEEKLENALDGENEKKLRSELELLQVEILQLREEKTALQEKNLNLQSDLAALQTTTAPSQTASAIPPPPPPAPAPPPPPPPPPVSGDNSRNVADLIAQRKADRGNAPVDPIKSPKVPTALDNFASAMDEMMKRIKSGAPMVRNTSNFTKIGKKADGSSTDSDSDNSADEQEYKQFCSRIGSSRRKRFDANERSSTLPARIMLTRNQRNLNIWKPRKVRLPSSEGYSNGASSTEQPKANFNRDGSVRHPDTINPDLRKILEKQRQKMKSAHD